MFCTAGAGLCVALALKPAATQLVDAEIEATPDLVAEKSHLDLGTVEQNTTIPIQYLFC